MLLDDDIELVKSQVSMVDIAGYYGMRVNRKGFTLCPFHNDKHPSMQVFSGYMKNDGYYCRSCGAGGTIFNFVMNYEGKSFEEAVRMVANAFGIKISDGNNMSPDAKKKAVSQRIQGAMMSANPYGEIFCEIGNELPVLQGEWDEKFNEYCDRR